MADWETERKTITKSSTKPEDLRLGGFLNTVSVHSFSSIKNAIKI